MALDRQLWMLDAMAQAELVRRRQVQPIELVEAAIARIERLNPRLNAIVLRLYDEARVAASRPLPHGPLAGVPFLLKDLLAECAGAPLGEGTEFLAGYVSPVDTELVLRLRRAGLLLLAKTNTPELGLLPTTEPRRWGPTRNPWDLDRTAGGSSGGSAVAVAVGLTPMAHGNDGGGSLRIPASCCGVFALKPTRERNPLGPHYGDLLGGLVVEHALTRSVRDSAALLDATCGADLGAPGAGAPARPFLAEVGVDPGRLRIAYSTRTPLGDAVHPDCAAAVLDAARLCVDLGHEVTPDAAPRMDGRALGRAFTIVWAAGCAWAIDDWARRTGRRPAREQFEATTWALQDRGRRFTASDYLLARQDMQRATREIARFFQDHDVWLTPVLGEPPPPLGSFHAPPEDPTRSLRRAGDFSPFTHLANMTGQPAMAVPLYWNAQDLPIGTHFVARFGEEATLFRLAAQLEGARAWRGRWPAIAD